MFIVPWIEELLTSLVSLIEDLRPFIKSSPRPVVVEGVVSKLLGDGLPPSYDEPPAERPTFVLEVTLVDDLTLIWDISVAPFTVEEILAAVPSWIY